MVGVRHYGGAFEFNEFHFSDGAYGDKTKFWSQTSDNAFTLTKIEPEGAVVKCVKLRYYRGSGI